MDADQFRGRCAAHLPAVLRFARTLCPEPADADDLVQETFARALRSCEALQSEGAMRSWMLRVAYTTFVDLCRRGRAAANVAVLVDEETQRRALERVATAATQGHVVAAAEVGAALRELPEHQRSALWLTGVEGYSYEEAAGICGCEVGTIRSRVSRGRAAVALALTHTARGGQRARGDGGER